MEAAAGLTTLFDGRYRGRGGKTANHESADLLHEEQVGDALFTSNESGQDFVQFRSLSLD